MRLRLAAVGATAIIATGFTVASLVITRSEYAVSTPAPTSTAPDTLPVGVVPLVSIIGDSYTAGSAMSSDGAPLWPDTLRWPLQIREQVLATGGTGYMADSAPVGEVGSTFAQRADNVAPDAALVVVFGSRNDMTFKRDAIESAADRTFSAIKARASDAKLLVIGPAWPSSNPPASILKVRDALADSAERAGATFVDPIRLDWFPTGNPYIGFDGVHPTDIGQNHLAELIKPFVKDELTNGGAP